MQLGVRHDLTPSSSIGNSRSRRISVYLDPGATTPPSEYVAEAVDRLSRRLEMWASHPVARAVDSWSGKRLQGFFRADDPNFQGAPEERSSKPVSYSPSAGGLVISVPNLERVLESQYPDQRSFHESDLARNFEYYTLNRLEFGIHEYGHIISANKLLTFAGDGEELARLERCAYESVAGVPVWAKRVQSLSLMKEILSDLRAEVVRRDVVFGPECGRAPDAFPTLGIIDRVLPGGIQRSPAFSMFGLLRMAAWYPVSRANGRQDLADVVVQEIGRWCREAQHPEFVSVVERVMYYLDAYMQSYTFDPERLYKAVSR